MLNNQVINRRLNILTYGYVATSNTYINFNSLTAFPLNQGEVATYTFKIIP